MKVEKWSWTAAFLFAGFFLATSLYIATKRLFWFDEIITVLIARLPDVKTIWSALLHSADLLPLPYYLIVRASEKLFGHGELAARLPSALGLTAAMLLTFDATRRLSDGLHGLIAESVIVCSFLPFYGHEARPYGICVAVSALLLWIWVRTAEKSKPAAVAFGCTAMAGTLVHYYVLLCLAPYAIFDFLRRRWFSPKLIAGAVGAGLALVLVAPELSVGHEAGSAKSWWAHPSVSSTVYAYQEFFPTGLFLLAMIVLWIAIAAGGGKDAVESMSAAERVGWLHAVIPVAGFVLAEIVTHSFVTRYFSTALPGIALGFGCLVYRHFGRVWHISAVVALLLAIFATGHQLAKVRHPELINSTTVYFDEQNQVSDALAQEDALIRSGKKYFGIQVGRLLWLETWYYSKHRDAHVALLNADSSGHHSFLEETEGLRFWTLQELKQHAHETVVIEAGPELLEKLKTAGMQPVFRSYSVVNVYELQ